VPGEVVLLTGAGSGLGRALALALSAGGRHVVITGRRAGHLAATADACVGPGAGEVVAVVGDITRPEVPAELVQAAQDRFGRLDAVINNAAVARFGDLAAGPPTVFEQLLQTNLVGPTRLIAAAVPALRDSQGSVVNIGSVGGLLALPGRALYGASKASLHHLTRSLARELAPDIRVNAVVPGAIDTEMYDDLGLDAGQTAELREQLVATTPLGRMGTVDDVVPWVELLLGPAGHWVTGALLVVDGGRSC
jgi:NAD(P)-dependent dehydrogenase (short-subunit alcohol dehydrogenase family)